MEYVSDTLFTTRLNNIQVMTQMSGPTLNYNCGTWIQIWYCSCYARELPEMFGGDGSELKKAQQVNTHSLNMTSPTK